MCDQKRKESEDWAMEQNDGFGVRIWVVAEVVNVAVRAEAAKHLGARWGINGEALGSDGDFAIVSDPDMGALAPDKGPPRAGPGPASV